MRLLARVVLLVVPFLLVACASTTVRRNPGPHDNGVRYYRPKPYLFLSPTEGKSDDFVSMSLQWLPDFSEEYSIHVRAGVGINKTQIKLDNGWNLTSVNYDIDSQTDENITALAKLIPEVAKLGSSKAEGAKTEAVQIKATNVPLGFYESVISRSSDGLKRMYGWRYVGFLPYAHCPVESGGVECVPCQSEPLYGMVFENGVMTFKPLDQTKVANNIRETKSGSDTLPATIAAIKTQAVAAYQTVLQSDVSADDVTVKLDDKTFIVTVKVSAAVFTRIEPTLDSYRGAFVTAFQPKLLKIMKDDPSWLVSSAIVKKP